MSSSPGDHPLPYLELDKTAPNIHTFAAGTILYRMHPAKHNAINFGRKSAYRFDAPDGSFGVLYAGEDAECCFAESCVPTVAEPAVSGAYLRDRHISELKISTDLHFVDLVESGSLVRLGADGRLFTGSYTVSQAWSAALKHHPTKPDGIRYRSRHDPARIAYAIYERPDLDFTVTDLGSVMDTRNQALLYRILDLYKVDFIDP